MCLWRQACLRFFERQTFEGSLSGCKRAIGAAGAAVRAGAEDERVSVYWLSLLLLFLSLPP